MKTRFQKARANAVSTLLYQLVAVGCGILVPKIIIGHFGSEVYGATTSITQFLSYITLLEAGIGGVARAELYRPLVERNTRSISEIYNAVRHWFRLIGCAFLVYVVILASTFNKIAEVDFFEPAYSFLLVVVIAISTAAQYFFGIANLTLINADQKRYISNIVMILTTVVNAALTVVLVWLDCDILTVKLCSSGIFVIRPILFSLYVKKNYQIDKNQKPERDTLSQRWTGLGQHLAYCLHKNTDVAVLTVLADVKYVAVYSVYHLVVSSIQNIITALTGGMESLFGDMLAKGEEEKLQVAYSAYDMLVSFTTLLLFGVTSILILPFIELYTRDVADAQYYQPMFAFVLILAESINCMLIPCTSIPVAANKFSETKFGAYGEVLINVLSSCLLVLWNPLVGVALGTLLAALYKSIFYFCYVSKRILHTSLRYGIRYLLYILLLMIMAFAGNMIIGLFKITSALQWIVWGLITFICAFAVVFLCFNWIFGKQFAQGLYEILRKFRNRNKA